MKKIVFISLLFYATVVNAQQFTAGHDTVICLGQSVELQGQGPQLGYTYYWTANPLDPTLINPTSLTPEVAPTDTTIYTLEGRYVNPNNLVVNGDFETGDNTGFYSAYQLGPGGSIYGEGTYVITNDASLNHQNFTCDNNHTYDGEYFMAVNGDNIPNTIVWQQVINVIPNTEYEFSTWIMSLDPQSPAVLQFEINGNLIGDPFQASSVTCEWNQFFIEWNSGIFSTATITIVNQNLMLSGNDFALDDINFSEVEYYYDDCEVAVTSSISSDFDLPAEICSYDTAVAIYTGNASPSADYSWAFQGLGTATGPGPHKLVWPLEGTKTVSLTVEEGCVSTPTTKNIEVLQSPAITVKATPDIIPYGTISELIGSNSGSGQATFEWQPKDSVVDPDHFRTDTKPLRRTTLFTFICTNIANSCVSEDTVRVHVTGGPLSILSHTASPDTICSGQESELSVSISGGSGNYTNTWTSDPSGFSYTGPESSVIVSPSVTTSYFITTSDGMTTMGPDTVTVFVIPPIDIVNQPKDTTILFDGTANFSVQANNQLSYQWQESIDDGATWANLNDIAPYSGTQTAILLIMDAYASMNGNLYRCIMEGECDPVISDSALLIITGSPDIVGELQSKDVCQYDTVYIPCTLSNFNEIDSLSLIFSFDTTYLSYLKTVVYPMELQNLTDEAVIDNISLFWSNSDGVTIEDGLMFDLAFIARTGGTTEVVSDAGSILRNTYGFYPDLIINSSQIQITALPVVPDSALVYPDSLNLLDEVEIDLESFGGSGDYLLWTTDSCGGDSVGTGHTLSITRPEQTTAYFAQWTNVCGYTECKSAMIKIVEHYAFAVPNAFTPNNDGKNDKFGVITPSTLPVFRLNIYNRWGQLIFSSDNQNEYWDGTYNGEVCPNGVYIWKTNYQYRTEGKGSETHEETGTVTLIR